MRGKKKKRGNLPMTWSDHMANAERQRQVILSKSDLILSYVFKQCFTKRETIKHGNLKRDPIMSLRS